MGTYENQQTIHFTNITVLVKEALLNKCWIYNSYSKEWFSPEQFLERYKDVQYQQGWIEHHKIMNPIAGLKAADLQIEKINQKRTDFQQRVFEYYQNKAK
jgi:hypothetical protein